MMSIMITNITMTDITAMKTMTMGTMTLMMKIQHQMTMWKAMNLAVTITLIPITMTP